MGIMNEVKKLQKGAEELLNSGSHTITIEDILDEWEREEKQKRMEAEKDGKKD